MTRLQRLTGVVRWIVGVGAATAVVLLFALEGAPPEATATPTGELQLLVDQGREIYDQRCATCHGNQGQGGQGPRLAGTVLVNYPDPAEEIDVVANGLNGMPPFALALTNEEIAAVVAFTRLGLS